jgi:prolyl 4-hydroxylase
MIYLNDVPEGGETRFDALGIAFKPRQGMAVIWNNLRGGLPNPDTMHAGLPVLQGHKYIVTQWFREKPCSSAGGGSRY